MKCECGCTKMTRITNRGKLNRFLNGHGCRGVAHTAERRKDTSRRMMGNRNAFGSRFKQTEQWKKWNSKRMIGNQHALGSRFKHTEKFKTNQSERQMGHNNSFFGKKHSEETKRNNSGDKYWNWQGGVSFEPYPSVFNKILKGQIKDRDGDQCRNPRCRGKYNRLHIHHIDYNKDNCSPGNLITVCASCNARANYNRGYWARMYSGIISQMGAV